MSISDTLTLPEGFSFNNIKLSDDKKNIVDSKGNIVFKIDGLKDTDRIENLRIDNDKRTIEYKAVITNPYFNAEKNTCTKEMDNPNLTVTLKKEAVKAGQNYKDKKINNRVDFEATSILDDKDTSKSSVDTIVKDIENTELKKECNVNGNVKENQELTYTITVSNKGFCNTEARELKDIFPKELILLDDNGKEITTNQSDVIIGGKKASVTFDENGVATIIWSKDVVGVIKPDENFKVDVKAKVKAKEANVSGFKNTAQYSDKTAEVWKNYEPSKIEEAIQKTVVNSKGENVAGKVVKDGEILTYTIKYTNNGNTTINRIIKDEFPIMGAILLDSDGKEVVFEKNPKNVTLGEAPNTYTASVYLDSNNQKEFKFSTGDIKPKETKTFTYKVKADESSLPNTGANYERNVYNRASSDAGINSGANVVVIRKGVEPKKEVVDENGKPIKGELAEGKDIYFKVSLVNDTNKEIEVRGTVDTLPRFEWNGSWNTTDFWKSRITILENKEGKGFGIEPIICENQIKWWSNQNPVIKVPANTTLYEIVKVTMPSGEDWNKFKEKIKEWDGTYVLKNQFQFSNSKMVEVKVTEKGKFIDIQKGVYSIMEYNQIYKKYIPLGGSRYTFPSKQNMYVLYYFTAKNVGKDSITIYEAKDMLPEGVSFYGMCDYYGNYMGDYNYEEKSTLKVQNGFIISNTDMGMYNNNVIGSVSSDSDNNQLTFSFLKAGSSEKGLTLEKGQSVQFAYLCEIDKSYTDENLDRNMLNKIALSSDAELYDVENWKANNEGDLKNAGQNNGGSKTIDGSEYGDNNNEHNWIESKVSIKPTASIVPGISKKAVSYISSTGQSINFKNHESIASGLNVKWSIDVDNRAGTIPMKGYKIVDVLDKPYTIKNISYNVYDSKGNVKATQENIEFKQSEEKGLYEYEVEFQPGNLDIPAGGYGKLEIETENNTADHTNRVYFNKVKLIPSQKFDGQNTTLGQANKEDGVWNNITSSDYVNALGRFGTLSEKIIYEKDNPDNIGYGKKVDEKGNYIYVSRSEDGTTDEVVYINRVENTSENNYSKFVMIDSMPHVNDNGVVNANSKRDSEFKVSLLDTPDFKVEIKNSSDNKVIKTLIKDTDYVVEYSNKEAPFSEADWNGKSSWNLKYDNISNAFRIKLLDTVTIDGYSKGVHMPKGTYIEVTYTGVIEKNANPGQFAWNSFGYRYYCQGTSLTAEPPKVGVAIPAESVIKKIVKNENGDILGSDENITFEFNIYEGKVSKEDVNTHTPIKTLTIAQGGYAKLETKRTVNGILKGYLENNKEYTVVEKQKDKYNTINISDGVNSAENYFTFTFLENENQTIEVVNEKIPEEVVVEKLPSTGGMGRDIYLFSGILIMAIAFFIRLKTKGNKVIDMQK